ITVGALAAPAFLAPSSSSPGSQLRGAQVSQPAAKTQTSTAAGGVLGAAAVTAVASFLTTKRQSARAGGSVCYAFDPSKQVGATKPLGFFDPAGFTKDIDEKGFKKLRSIELRHARGAMMGSVGLLVQSVYKFPGFESVPSSLAAQWTEPGSNALWLLFCAIGCFDIGLSPWKEDPEDPGNFGDPLNLAKGNITDDIRNRELNNGRFAMFAFLGIVSAELYTGNSAIGQFATAPVKTTTRAGAFCGTSLMAKTERAEQSLQSRRAFDGSSLPGAIAPLGYFDPLGLSGTQERFDKFRAAEVKHGRIAMLAILGAFAGHWATPLGAPAGIAGFQDPIGAKGCVALTFACAFLETGPWSDAYAKEPGNYGDPCDFANIFGITGEKMDEMKTKELSNGRLAMMATIGMCVQEGVFGEKFSDLPAQLGF
ncbi:Fucoxanthin-chlorophyll a-c binding protein E, partial [Durusdinium trenchii]